MNRTLRFCGSCCCWLLTLAVGAAAITARAQEEPNAELMQMIADLVRDPQREMRALGLQQIRDEIPGEAATKRFAELLPSLPPDAQAALLEALGERGDPTARPAVLAMLASDAEPVRAAALGALGVLGTTEDVARLAEKAAGDSSLEQTAAIASLMRLRGDQIDAAIVAEATTAEPTGQSRLLNVLGRRNAKQALPLVLAAAKEAAPPVRLAALDALRLLAEPKDVADVLAVLRSAGDSECRAKAELALLAVCQRGGAACAESLAAGLSDADTDTKRVLIRALARAGGDQALQTICGQLQDNDGAVRDEAVRALSNWNDPAVADVLFSLASGDNLRHQVLAVRGLVRLADSQGDRPADTALLARIQPLAKRPAEQRLVLGALSRSDAEDALTLALPYLAGGELTDEAALAVVGIADRVSVRNATVREALQQVLETSQHSLVRQRAQEILENP
ncbi:MAG: HEAT repeat domain-containing protein [Pirellulaceae bacterium]|nr:HEAT repeat domain-containing protein [Pirellulaceae bacterium]